MKIGGFIKNSFIDYPGKISCVIFTSGCNFRCPYCHNFDLISDKKEVIDIISVYEFIESKNGLIDGIVVSGGEPVMHHDIEDLLVILKSTGLPIKLDTNGSFPVELKNILDKKLVDYVAMDIKTSPYRYSSGICNFFVADNIIESINYIKTSGIDYEFRTTCVKPFIDEISMRDICHIIKNTKKFVLQKATTKKCLNKNLFTPSTDDEILKFKAIMDKNVDSCVIR